MAEDARLANVGVAGWNAAAYFKADMATVAIIVEVSMVDTVLSCSVYKRYYERGCG